MNYHVDAFSEEIGRRYLWRVYTGIGKYVAKTATHIVADSDFEANYVRNTFNVRNDKLSTILLGVDPIFYNRLPKPDNSLEKGAVNLFFVGYLIKRKNVPSVLYALHELMHRFEIKDVSLTVVGTGLEKGHLLHLAEELGIDGRITWKETLSNQNLVNEFLKADVFLLLSKSEAYGIAVAEALSVGAPCIVADTTALHEFTKELGCFGVESPPDPQEVAQLILDISNWHITTVLSFVPYSNVCCEAVCAN